MFNLGFAELILLLLIALLVVGPKDLPKVARWLGRCVNAVRRMIREVKQELGWDEIMDEGKVLRNDVQQTIRDNDPTADLKDVSKDFKEYLDKVKKETGVKKP